MNKPEYDLIWEFLVYPSRVAVCCRLLQCVAVYWCVLICVATRGSVWQCCKVLQCIAACHRVAVCCRVSQCIAVCCIVLHCVAGVPFVLQCVAVCCSVLQCVAAQGAPKPFSALWVHTHSALLTPSIRGLEKRIGPSSQQVWGGYD